MKNRVQRLLARALGRVAFLRPYRKAIAGFLSPGIVAVAWAVIVPSSPGGHAVTSAEWQGALAASLATAGIVWGVRNKGVVK
jgi:hypothetical protein